MFTVSEENTVKCLEGFSWKPHKSFSSAQIAHELWARAQRGCSCSLFFRNVFWETWGVLGTNLVPGTHDPLVSVEAEGETILAAMAASSGFSSCVVKVTKL